MDTTLTIETIDESSERRVTYIAPELMDIIREEGQVPIRTYY